jgi:hypothetical protein
VVHTQGHTNEVGGLESLATDMATMSRLRLGLAAAEQRLAKVLQTSSNEHPNRHASRHEGAPKLDCRSDRRPVSVSESSCQRESFDSGQQAGGEVTCKHANGAARDEADIDVSIANHTATLGQTTHLQEHDSSAGLRERAERAEALAGRLRMRAAGAEREADLLRTTVSEYLPMCVCVCVCVCVTGVESFDVHKLNIVQRSGSDFVLCCAGG